MKRVIFFSIGYIYAFVFGFMETWKALRQVYKFEAELRKIINTPFYKTERKIDCFIYRLERSERSHK